MKKKKKVVKGSKASDKGHMIKIFRKAGFTEEEIADYYRRKEYKAKKVEKPKPTNKKREPIIFYGYNTVSK